MPKWLRQQHTVSTSANATVGQLRGFFNKMAAYQRQGRLTTPGPIVNITGGAIVDKKTGKGMVV